MRSALILACLAVVAPGCSDPLEDGMISFCMQWQNASEFRLTMQARDEVNNLVASTILNAPVAGDTMKSGVFVVTADPPLTFSSTNGFGAATATPLGGNSILVVSASRTSGVLESREEAGTCPGATQEN